MSAAVSRLLGGLRFEGVGCGVVFMAASFGSQRKQKKHINVAR